jgi:hypothetical protein
VGQGIILSTQESAGMEVGRVAFGRRQEDGDRAASARGQCGPVSSADRAVLGGAGEVGGRWKIADKMIPLGTPSARGEVTLLSAGAWNIDVRRKPAVPHKQEDERDQPSISM